MKKLFGVRMSQIKDIVMSLSILDILEENIGKTYNIFSIAKSCKDIIPIIKNHEKIQEIKISDYENDLGEKDFKIIQKCDYYINPKPLHPKEKDWYNYRSSLEEACFMATLDYKLLKTMPKIIYKKKQKFKKTSCFIVSKYFDQELKCWLGPPDSWWDKLLQNNNGYIEDIYSAFDLKLSKKYINLKNKPLEEQVEIISKCHLIIGAPSDLTWISSAIGQTDQINILSNEIEDHKTNYNAFAPIGENTKNIFFKNYYDDDESLEKLELAIRAGYHIL